MSRQYYFKDFFKCKCQIFYLDIILYPCLCLLNYSTGGYDCITQWKKSILYNGECV